MNSFSPLHRVEDYKSIVPYQSEVFPKVTFSIRRISLGLRLELAKDLRALSVKEEFLRAGDTLDQLEAAVCDLQTRKLLLDWGLVEIKGLKIDGQPANAQALLERGPESLALEIVAAIQAQAGLSETEIKNS